MKLLVKFTKLGGAVFMSHLDLLRCVQRILRRAGLPIAYSQGFNPHPILSFAQALSLGMDSRGEYFETELTQEIAIDAFLQAFNQNAPEGIEALNARWLDEKEKSAMALVAAADYELTANDAQALQNAVAMFCGLDAYTYKKKSKSGAKVVDMKPMVLQVEAESNTARCRLSCGNTNLAVGAFGAALCDIAQNEMELDMIRMDLLRDDGRGGYISLMEP